MDQQPNANTPAERMLASMRLWLRIAEAAGRDGEQHFASDCAQTAARRLELAIQLDPVSV